MRDRLRLFRARDLDHPFRDQRPRNAGSKKVLVLINRACLKHWKNEIASEFFLKIFDHVFRCAGLERFLFEAGQLFFLTDVGAESDDLRAIIVFQPAKNDRRIESAGVSEDNFHRKSSSQIPSSKTQIPKKFQSPILKRNRNSRILDFLL